MRMIFAMLTMLFSVSSFADEIDESEDYMPRAAYVEANEDQDIAEAPLTESRPATTAEAESAKPENTLSKDCIKSVSHLYRFYFHEIYPNPKNEACKNQSSTLGDSEAAEMKTVISDLKKHCPATFITQVNASFRELKAERDA